MDVNESKSESQEKHTGITACGGKLKDPSKYPNAEYRGETVYFCIRACLRVFRENPDAFMSGDVEHPKDDD